MLPQRIVENGTEILTTPGTFYNPAQKINRDLTILCINEFVESIPRPKIFEAMSATGLRGIRFAKELPPCDLYLNDRSLEAVDLIKQNLEANSIHPMQDEHASCYKHNQTQIYITSSDCNAILCSNLNKFDVIDIDPFGCPTPYINNALYSIKNNGLLCLTSTDTGVLCSHRKKCLVKYNALIAPGNPAHHDHALRILIGYTESQAGKYGKTIEPILSLSIDFYIRVLLRVKRRKVSSLNIAHYLYCKCYNMWNVDQNINKCTNCGNEKLKLCGPFYNGHLNDKSFIEKIVTEDERIIGLLNLVKDEIDTFMLLSIPSMSRVLKINCIPLLAIMSALLNSDFDVSLSHCEINAIKTTAPINVVYELMKRYSRNKDDAVFNRNARGSAILQKTYNRGKMFSKMGPLSLPKK